MGPSRLSLRANADISSIDESLTANPKNNTRSRGSKSRSRKLWTRDEDNKLRSLVIYDGDRYRWDDIGRIIHRHASSTIRRAKALGLNSKPRVGCRRSRWIPSPDMLYTIWWLTVVNAATYTLAQIAKMIGRHVSTLCRLLKRHGWMKGRQRPFHPPYWFSVRDLVLSGLSFGATAKQLKIPRNTVARICHVLKVKSHHTYTFRRSNKRKVASLPPKTVSKARVATSGQRSHTIHDLVPRQCRWPLWGENGGEKHYCAAPVDEHRWSTGPWYCDQHFEVSTGGKYGGRY